MHLQVWAIADSKRQGYLGFYEFMTAMQVCTLIYLIHVLLQSDLCLYGLVFLFVYIKPDSNVQLVSLAQAGNEISQNTLSNAGKAHSKEI